MDALKNKSGTKSGAWCDYEVYHLGTTREVGLLALNVLGRTDGRRLMSNSY